MSDLDLYLEVNPRSYQPLRYTRRLIYRKTVRDRGLVPKDHHRKWLTWNQMATWQITSLDPERSNSCPLYAKSLISQKRLEIEFLRSANRIWPMGYQMSRLEQKWFISVRGESEKNAIEVSRCCGLRAQPGSRYLQ